MHHQVATTNSNINRSKLASILSPYDCKDDDESENSTIIIPCIVNSQQHNGSRQMHNNKQPNKVTRNTFTLTNKNTNAISHMVHGKLSTFIHCDTHPKKFKSTNINIRRYEQKSTPHKQTAIPSRNKRLKLNHKLIQTAQLSSHRVIFKMVRLGRRCTKKLSTLRHAIQCSVAKAIANANSMLHKTPHRSHGTNRGQGVQLNKKRKVKEKIMGND